MEKEAKRGGGEGRREGGGRPGERITEILCSGLPGRSLTVTITAVIYLGKWNPTTLFSFARKRENAKQENIVVSLSFLSRLEQISQGRSSKSATTYERKIVAEGWGSGGGKVFFFKGAPSQAALRNSGIRNQERVSRRSFVHGYSISLPTPTPTPLLSHYQTFEDGIIPFVDVFGQSF